jgi:hypothetical protein
MWIYISLGVCHIMHRIVLPLRSVGVQIDQFIFNLIIRNAGQAVQVILIGFSLNRCSFHIFTLLHQN